jgi:hypothetical protein
MLSLAYALTGNNIVSQVRQFRAGHAPIVHLLEPANSSGITYSRNISFKYNVSDDSAIINCSLYLNGQWNSSNQSAVSKTLNNTINATLEDGEYNWSISCFDNLTIMGSSEIYNLSIDYQLLSISLVDNLLEFGQCIPQPGTGSWFESNDTSLAGTGEGKCTGLANPQNLTVENDGNMRANVTIQIDSIDITGHSSQQIWFALQNASNAPGCMDSLQNFWANFTNINTEYIACQDLNAINSLDSIWAFLRVFVPSSAPAGNRTVIVTFTAHNYND